MSGSDDEYDRLPSTIPPLVRRNATSPDPCTYGIGLERKKYFKVVDGGEIPVYSDELFCNHIINAKRNSIFTGRVNNINVVEYDYPEHLFKKSTKKSTRKSTRKSKGTKKTKETKKTKGIKTKKTKGSN